MNAPMFCEKRHRKLKFEEKRPPGECGGVMDEARSADGTYLYGYVCRTCGAGKKICEGCGDLFVNLDRHMFDNDGNERECYKKAPMYRTARVAGDFGKRAP